ncbi:MAG TPA: HNH endonuclease [Pseudacidobacterium sp.]|nr:HNH endonuclease [Pseudacidobacterium sp.]
MDALSLLIEFLTIAGTREQPIVPISGYLNDDDGDGTLKVLRNSVQILSRLTGNGPGSLGLHPAVYFYNEQGKYSRFLFLGMTALVSEKLRNNNAEWFKAFTLVRQKIEQFLLNNKSTIGLVLQNMGKTQRVPKMRDLFDYLVATAIKNESLEIQKAISHLGITGRILEVNGKQASPHISDDTKSMLFIQNAIAKALPCPICGGLLDPQKSVSYDHIKAQRDGGSGHINNIQMTHPYCNTGYKEFQSAKEEKERGLVLNE